MATIRTSIQVQDAATATLNKIDSGLNKVNRGFENVNTQMSEVPTKGLQATQKMTQSALQAEMAYKAEAQQLSIIEKEAKNILATKGTESIESKEILASLYEQRVLVSSLKADYERITQSAKGTSESIRENEENQRKFKNEINSTTTSANNLWDKIKGIALTIGGLAGVKKILNLSDEMATTSARLSLIVDDKGSVEQLENKIFASAIRSRAEYQDTADMIGKLGSQAKGAFKNNDELIAFAEQLNKNFILAGTNQQGIASAQLQITQALASGVLRGEELNAVFENATPVIQKIADYLDVPIGKIRDLAKDGKLSAQVVKNALLASADETNAAFEKMPMTWSQIWTKMKNIALKAFQPVLKKINEFANNQKVQAAFESFINVISVASQAVLGLIEGMVWLYGILEPFAPMILGIVAAYVAFNLISGLVSIALGIMSAMETAHAAAAMLASGATLAETAAQWGLNSALYACPIVWIIAIIIALIAVLTYLWFTNDDVAYGILYAWDALRLGAMTLWLGCKTVFYGILLAAQFMWLGMLGVCYGLLTAWYGFQTGLEAVGVGILYIFQWLYNGVVGIVNRNYRGLKQNTWSFYKYS